MNQCQKTPEIYRKTNLCQENALLDLDKKYRYKISMSILVIGQSSFLAKSLKNTSISGECRFADYNTAKTSGVWKQGLKTVINFAHDPIASQQGDFSSLDNLYASKAEQIGAHYIMLSSRAVYGLSPQHDTFDEESGWLDKVTNYGASKRLIEKDLQARFNNITIIRPTNIFGSEYAQDKPRKTFFGTMLSSLKESGTITFDIAPETFKDFLPLNSFSNALTKILKNPKSGAYNLGSGTSISINEIAQTVIEGYGEGEIIYSPPFKEGDSFGVNIDKIKQDYKIETTAKEPILNAVYEIGSQLRDQHIGQ